MILESLLRGCMLVVWEVRRPVELAPPNPSHSGTIPLTGSTRLIPAVVAVYNNLPSHIPQNIHIHLLSFLFILRQKEPRCLILMSPYIGPFLTSGLREIVHAAAFATPGSVRLEKNCVFFLFELLLTDKFSALPLMPVPSWHWFNDAALYTVVVFALADLVLATAAEDWLFQ